MIIYKTTNLINGKFYVGKDAKNRKYYLGSGKVLRLAIEKYGKENFKKEILEVCSSLEELSEREKYWIKALDSINSGYNITEGGTGGDTYTFNPHKELISSKLKGRNAWNKGTTGICKAWNKGTTGIMTANKTSYKKGEEHPLYGTIRDKTIYEKIVNIRRQKNNFKGVGKFASKRVMNIDDGLEFSSIQEAAEYYNISRDKVGHSCRKETKTGKFRFVKSTEVV
jgi:group I intron endonuclease